MIAEPKFLRIRNAVETTNWLQTEGIVNSVVGIVIEANGPDAKVGEWCQLLTEKGPIDAEVVGFRGNKTLLMPLGEVSGVKPSTRVKPKGQSFLAPCGVGLLGRVLDGLGRPMDDLGPLNFSCRRPTLASPPPSMSRPPICNPIETGVRAIDGFLTLGEGQRMGIFAGSGVGKSTLLGMIARRSSADVNVICLVGERGRELREFIENDLQEEGLAKSVIVCSTSDQSALVRIKAAFVATTIAESFRDEGKKVMLMMDSVTRFAMAQREVGLATGEPPSTKGYTPSVFALLPKLMERAGCSDKGSITALYTVLVDGDDTDEPISDAARSILDGHIVLSRKLTSRGHYPPIDILQSLSRTMPQVISSEHSDAAQLGRGVISSYNDVADLVSIGAYKPGSNPKADFALKVTPQIEKFLCQKKNEFEPFDQTLQQLQEALRA